jgi:hypothetical protein
MTVTTCNGPDDLDLSRADAWVLHAALLRWIEGEIDEDRTPRFEFGLLRKVEECEPLTTAELRVVRQVLEAYRDEAPPEDEAAVESLLSDVDDALLAA